METDFGISERFSSLCIFATYREKNTEFSENVLFYIDNLSKYFDYLIVVADIENGVPEKKIFPQNCCLNLVPNVGSDFGKFWSVLQVLKAKKDIYQFDKIALINDSCSLIKDLKCVFDWGKNKPFWGISLSIDYHPHIQSFFLVFEQKEAILKLFEFVSLNDIYKCSSRDELIQNYEIGLSKFMIKQGFELNALYKKEKLKHVQIPGFRFRGNPNNVAFFMWDKMLHVGCPIVKNKRKKISNDSAFVEKYVDQELKKEFLNKINNNNSNLQIFYHFPK